MPSKKRCLALKRRRAESRPENEVAVDSQRIRTSNLPQNESDGSDFVMRPMSTGQTIVMLVIGIGAVLFFRSALEDKFSHGERAPVLPDPGDGHEAHRPADSPAVHIWEPEYDRATRIARTMGMLDATHQQPAMFSADPDFAIMWYREAQESDSESAHLMGRDTDRVLTLCFPKGTGAQGRGAVAIIPLPPHEPTQCQRPPSVDGFYPPQRANSRLGHFYKKGALRDSNSYAQYYYIRHETPDPPKGGNHSAHPLLDFASAACEGSYFIEGKLYMSVGRWPNIGERLLPDLTMSSAIDARACLKHID